MNWPRLLSILFVAYLVVFAQSHFGFVRHVIGAQVDALPSLLVFTGLTSSLPAVVVAAVASGLWLDCLSANPLGLSILPLALAGMVAHGFRSILLRDDFGTRYLLGLTASAAAPLVTLGLLFVAGEEPLYRGWFAWRWLAGAAIGAGFMPVFFIVFARLDQALNYVPEPSTGFRADREIDRGRDPHAHH
jgi:rod shape-determining protein MreD